MSASENRRVAAATEEYPDDGHIFVCVRVRDVPHNVACLTNSSGSAVNANNTRTSTVARKSMARDAQKICVSVVENVVVMHDPKAVDDAATVAKDGNNVVQMLTDRANRTNGGGKGNARPSRRTVSGGAAAANTRTTGRRTTVGGRGTTTTAGGGSYLVPTGTANYYECDHCITSMEESQLLQMPLIRTSDFLQPPPYGTQEDVYRRTAMHAVRAAVEGINSCVFAYGQTGSGKTYTLFGDTANMRRDPGIVPRTLDDLFSQLESVKQSYKGDGETDYSYNVQVSFFEIYQNEVYCLFSRQGPLHVQFVRDPTGKKETMIINDLQQQAVTSAEKAYPLIEMGLRRRQTAETGMNARSSRSHAILQIRVAQYRTNRDTRETVEHQATINLVDLAGSERQKTANTDGKTRDEGIQINQSLATLARVINDIASGAKFVNYRDSLLTMVLKDNLGGNSKTFMIANISPIAFSFSESCATLTYAKDVRKIRNRPMVNKTFQTRANLLEQNSLLKQENEKLKEQMEAWVRSLQSGSAPLNLEAMPMLRGALQQRIAPADAMGGVGAGDHQQGSFVSPPPPPCSDAPPSSLFPDGSSAAAAMMSGGNEVFLSATSAGLTAPLLIASHRRYTSVAGIGGSCVEGGVVRVSALVRETMRFPLRAVLGRTHPTAGDDSKDEETGKEEPRHTVVVMDSEEEEEGEEGEEAATRDASPSPDAMPTDFPHEHPADHPKSAIQAAGAAESSDLGILQLDRVAQRSCEQRFYVHFLPPTSADGLSRLIDVQVNGKSIGEKTRRELHHGDVVCAYLEDGENSAGGLRAQSLVSFHYVDLNALARNAASAASGAAAGTTLGQLAVSVDIPEDLENLTLEGIKQLKRDNAKLLDLVRQQAETIDFQCARASLSQVNTTNLLDGISPVCGSHPSVSPDPRSLEASPSAIMPLDPRNTAVAVAEAFRRLSEPRGLRAGSVMPADIEADELLRRAAAQSESQQRLDSAVKENEKLHRTVVSRNATLDALARRLAELEAGDDVARSSRSSSSSSGESEEEGDDEEQSSAASSPSSQSESVSLSPSADRDAKNETVANRAEGEDGISMTRVSSPSAQRCESASASPADSPKNKKKKKARAVAKTDDDDDDENEEDQIGDGRKRVVYENTEGARERFQAVVREREQFDRIVELEALLRELRERLAELESRLRFAKDETLEQQLFREQAEAERDALTEELAELRRENGELRNDNASLEAYLAKDEQALADAARLAEEELERQTSVLAERITALKAMARMWKQRTMKYIAMGYGAGEGAASPDGTATAAAAHLDAIPWDELRAAETVAIAKRRLGGTASADGSPVGAAHCTAVMAQTIEDFEKDTAVENLRALEYALLDFEQENQRLLDEIRRIQAELQRYKDLIDRLRAEKAEMERQLADATGATEEERRRMQRLLDSTNSQLNDAENNLKATQSRLDAAVAQCDNNKRKAVKNNELLLAQQKRTIAELEAELLRLRNDVAARDEELRNLTNYMEDRDAMGGDHVAKSYELRSRLEDLVADSMGDGDGAGGGGAAATGYSVFPAGYEFSDEMVALIRICLRILLDRLKMELYVLNSQSVHKFSLLIHAVKARTEAHFHTFMHQLRDAVSQMTGRVVRPGGKWALSEADVLANLVDHRRRQVGDALNGLLIWYDHWDSAPKTEHVAYMELIRNADRIMQMARLVRRESLLNTNATSTSLMPIPGKNGSSEKTLVDNGTNKKKDKTVRDSCKILTRLNSSTRQSNLARAVGQFSATPSRKTLPGHEDLAATSSGCAVEKTPFTRSATVTALALSQSMIPFSRTATGTRTSTTVAAQHQTPSAASRQSGGVAAYGESCPPFTRCASGLPRPSTTNAAGAVASLPPQLPLSATATATPVRPTKMSLASAENTAARSPLSATTTAAKSPALNSSLMSNSSMNNNTAAAAAAARANYSRMASAGVLPVSDADVAYVATTDVAEAVSINSYNFSRRMSLTPADGFDKSDYANNNNGGSSSLAASAVRRPNQLFSRCHTALPQPSREVAPSHTLRRQASAVPLKTRMSGGGVAGNGGHPSAGKAAEAFARSKTQYGSAMLPPPPRPVPTRIARRSGGSTGRDSGSSASRSSAGSPSVRASQLRRSANVSTFAAAPVGGGRQVVGSSSTSSDAARPSQRRSGTVKAAEAAPFYNPAVLQSLRERSTSDVNRTGPAAPGKGSLKNSSKFAASSASAAASHAGGKHKSVPAKTAPLSRTMSGMAGGSVGGGAAAATPGLGKTRKATAARTSVGYKAAPEQRGSSTVLSGRGSAGAGPDVPVVPALDFSRMSRDY